MSYLNAIMTNWRTTTGGAFFIAIGIFEIVANYHIPGFQMEPGTAIAAGISLLMAKDIGTK